MTKYHYSESANEPNGGEALHCKAEARDNGEMATVAEFAPKYPDVEVTLIGEDGNAFHIIALVSTALRRAGVDEDEINEFRNEATSGDYDNVLATCMKWVDIS